MTDNTTSQQPVLSAAGQGDVLDLGATEIIHRIKSADTNGAFSMVEFVAEPGRGAGVHTHGAEDELVYLLEGEIEVTLGDQKMTVPAGTTALLPKGIPHGYTTVGVKTSRLLAILLPGALDEFFVELAALQQADGDQAAAIGALAARYQLEFN